MAQTVILAAGQTAATSSDVTVTSGQATLSLQVAAGARIPGNIGLPIYLVQQGGIRRVVGALNAIFPTFVLDAPGVYQVDRELITSYAVDVAVLSDA